jgi:hypothetical protein
VRLEVHLGSQSELLEVIRAGGFAGPFSRGLDGWRQEIKQNADDRNDD